MIRAGTDPLTDRDGKPVTENHQIIFFQYLIWPPQSFSHHHQASDDSADDDVHALPDIVITTAVQFLKTNKSPGPENVHLLLYEQQKAEFSPFSLLYILCQCDTASLL